MPYCSQSDIEKKLPLQAVIELTDDANTGLANAAVISDAISQADALIDSYVGTVKQVPLSPVPVLVKNLSVTISIWYLHERRELDNEVRRRAFEDAVKELKLIAQKETTLDDGSENVGASDNSVQFEAPARKFTDETMGDF